MQRILSHFIFYFCIFQPKFIKKTNVQHIQTCQDIMYMIVNGWINYETQQNSAIKVSIQSIKTP